ncbi:hypothetical protein ACOME3_001069 [Neoechinorhynchus agilis]
MNQWFSVLAAFSSPMVATVFEVIRLLCAIRKSRERLKGGQITNITHTNWEVLIAQLKDKKFMIRHSLYTALTVGGTVSGFLLGEVLIPLPLIGAGVGSFMGGCAGAISGKCVGFCVAGYYERRIRNSPNFAGEQ